MGITQKQAILDDDNLPVFTIAGTQYKGRAAMYQVVQGKVLKVVKGVPYVRLTKKKKDIELERIALGDAIEEAVTEAKQ